MKSLTSILWLGALLALLPETAGAQSGDNVLVVINAASPQSVKIGEYYAERRSVAPDHLVRLDTPTAEGITRTDYERTIEAPVAEWLARHDLQDRILYIVLTSGVPIRIVGTGGLSGTVSSVDSELTLLYRRMLGLRIPPAGRIQNPYFLGDRPSTETRPFTRATADIYLVTRLDGFSVDDVLKLIDRGSSPVANGRVVLDQKATPGDRGGDLWLRETADRLSAMSAGDRVLIETTKALAATPEPVIGYFSWGSNDPANRARQSGLQFVAGSIGGLFVSTDGRTFKEPPASWTPGAVNSAFGDQSLAGDLIREGMTGVSAHVAEPYLDSIVRPQILFPAYLSGLNIAESFYLAMPFLSWQQLVIGDPLCAAFPRTTLAPSEIHKRLDPDTGLPAWFSERRLALLSPGGLKVAGLKLSLRAEALQAKGAQASEVDAVLAEATEVEPRLIPAQLRLAAGHEARGEYDRAIARYRAVVAADPDNVTGLNNLAYALADRKGAAQEALPLAQKAYRLSSQAPLVADTLGWVYYLLGDPKAALPLIERGAAGAGTSADIRLHAAIVHEALGNKVKAAAELEAALKLDPAFATRADVQALRIKLGKK